MSKTKQRVSRRDVRGTAVTLSIAGTIGLSLASSALAAPVATDRKDEAGAAALQPLTAPGACHLNALMERLARAPRRREFKTVPMILAHRDQWDHDALTTATIRGLWNHSEPDASNDESRVMFRGRHKTLSRSRLAPEAQLCRQPFAYQ
jgi:hypothetical protein